MRIFLLSLLTLLFLHSRSQMITGIWKGKINKQKVEIKIIQRGDSLTGTSYYYESASTYRRYSIRGYFDATTNSTVWWDDQLIEEKSRYSASTGKMPLLSRADFNCPGGGVMMLDGKAALKQDNSTPKGDLHLDKTAAGTFNDEWDYVIDNYTTGTNDPDVIDSVDLIARHETPLARQETVVVAPPATREPVPEVIERVPAEQSVARVPETVAKKQPPVTMITPSKAPTIEEKYLNRKKVFNKEIRLTGDSIELRFYDNAEIDGDSISLFLNDKLIFEHIRLTEKAYSVKLAVADLADRNELIMVAENLGAIPPNTSYMLAIVGDKRYDAYLASTEESSAMIRFVKGN